MKSILKMGVGNDKLARMPAFPKKTSEKNRKRKIYIKDDEYAVLMSVLRDFEAEEATRKGYTRKRMIRLEFLRRLIPFYYITGVRNREGVDLAWKPDVKGSSGYVDLKNGVIHLTRTKNKHRRIIPLDGEAREIIEAQWNDLRRTFTRDFDWVFFRKVNGRPERILDFRRAWKRALDEAGLPDDRRIHDFRRTARRNHRLAGTHISVSKAILGHMSDDVHEDYDTVEVEERRQAMENVARHRKTSAIAVSED